MILPEELLLRIVHYTDKLPPGHSMTKSPKGATMPHLRMLVLLTILVVLTVVAVILNFSTTNVSAYGSIVSGGGSLLAVIWFTASFWNQTRQLNEQRVQFAAQFHHLQESSRRDSLLMAKGILKAAE